MNVFIGHKNLKCIIRLFFLFCVTSRELWTTVVNGSGEPDSAVRGKSRFVWRISSNGMGTPSVGFGQAFPAEAHKRQGVLAVFQNLETVAPYWSGRPKRNCICYRPMEQMYIFFRTFATKNREYMKKAIWSTPRTEIQIFTPDAYVAACSFTAQVVCEISLGNYANGTTTISGTTYHNGAVDGLPHGTSCQTVTLTYNATTNSYSGYEVNKPASPLVGQPTFNWSSGSIGSSGTFKPGYGNVGAYVKWVTGDQGASGTKYTHEGHVSSWKTTNAS